jgi:hypothetical protein
MYHSNLSRDGFKECSGRNIWTQKIQLLDTTFWQQLTLDPTKYKDGFKRKNNLMAFDFSVIPMYNE